MKKSPLVTDPDAYVAALTGWRRRCVEELRAAVLAAAPFSEVVKWGHLVYVAQGPVLLIRAEDERVLLGFWRGQRLRAIEPRLRPGGEVRDGDRRVAGGHGDGCRRGAAPGSRGGEAQRAVRGPDACRADGACAVTRRRP